MYTPAHFAVDEAQAVAFLSSVRVVDLVTPTTSGLQVTFLPVVLESGSGLGSLHGHVARPNPHWREAAVGPSLMIAHGPNSYVSPNWYQAKSESGRVVPTWNYVTAHIYGTLVVHDDPEWVDSLVRRLTVVHEAEQPRPWSVDDAPTDYIAGQLRAIVGLELVIDRVEVENKMSQNRPATDVPALIEGLTEAGSLEVAHLVQEARPHS
jgi:transcriptional regulator